MLSVRDVIIVTLDRDTTRCYASQMLFDRSAPRQHWVHLRAQKWRQLPLDIRQATRAGLPADLRDRPAGVLSDYRVWQQACEQLGAPAGTQPSQRTGLYHRRAKVIDRLPPHLRDVPPDQWPASCANLRDDLEDIAWRLKALCKGHTRIEPLVDDWSTRCDPRVLRRRLTKYERYLRVAGGWIAKTDRALELQQIVTRLTDRTKQYELEEYESKLSEWRDMHAEDPMLYHGKTKPKRPGWLKEADTDEIIRDKRERRINAALKPLAPDPRKARLERAQIVSDRQYERKQEKRRSTLEAHVHALLDWAWGEARLMHIGEEIDGWLYIDDAHGVPRASTPSRAAALAACAVRLATGWAFPPETSRGRQ